MKRNQLLIVIVFAVLIVVALLFVWRRDTTVSDKKDKIRIAFIVPTLENPFFVDMINAAKTKADSEGNIELIIQAPQKVEDALGQNSIVENLITQKVDVICVVPTNSESIIPVIAKANAANIPVVNIDNRINMDLAQKRGAIVSAYVGSDNYAGGIIAGQYVVERLKGSGKVAILEGVSANDAAIKRKAGFLDALKSAPEISIVASQVGNWNREQAFTIFQNILKANPDLNAVFAANDEMALGAYAALQTSNIPKSKIIIVGFDAIQEAVEAVTSGKIDATIAQQPGLMGERAIQLALDIVNDRPVDTVYSTELKVIKK